MTAAASARVDACLGPNLPSLILNDESFKRQHEINVKTKSMKPMRSVMKLCGKLARLLVAMAQSGEAYESNRTLPLKQAA